MGWRRSQNAIDDLRAEQDRKFNATTHRTLAVITITALLVILALRWLFDLIN